MHGKTHMAPRFDTELSFPKKYPQTCSTAWHRRAAFNPDCLRGRDQPQPNHVSCPWTLGQGPAHGYVVPSSTLLYTNTDTYTPHRYIPQCTQQHPDPDPPSRPPRVPPINTIKHLSGLALQQLHHNASAASPAQRCRAGTRRQCVAWQ